MFDHECDRVLSTQNRVAQPRFRCKIWGANATMRRRNFACTHNTRPRKFGRIFNTERSTQYYRINTNTHRIFELLVRILCVISLFCNAISMRTISSKSKAHPPSVEKNLNAQRPFNSHDSPSYYINFTIVFNTIIITITVIRNYFEFLLRILWNNCRCALQYLI